jgi:putative MATE family efflux protein
MLVTLAGVGYLRGQRDTRRPLLVAIISALINLVLELILIYVFDFGIGASALSTVVAQWLAAGAYLAWITRSVRAEGVSLAIDWQAIGSLAIAGRDLFFRTSALKGSLLAATAAAAHLGTVDLAAHQVTFEIWALLALSLDAIAIAGQAIVANRLGASDAVGARAAAARMMTLGVLFGFLAAALVVVSRSWLPGLFTDDQAVVSLTAFLFWWMAISQPINGIAFTLDGLLIGAGDLRFLAFSMVGAAAIFIPVVLGLAWNGYGIGWVWAALTLFMALRAIPLWIRYRSGKWATLGATR